MSLPVGKAQLAGCLKVWVGGPLEWDAGIQSYCDVSPIRTALDHLHFANFLGSMHQTKRVMQSLVFLIVCHTLSVNVHARNTFLVIYKSTIEWYVTCRLV